MTEGEPSVDPSRETEAPLPPLFRRLVDVFFSPGRLFSALAGEPRWVGALLLGALLSTAALAVVPAEMWADTMRRAILESGQPLPEGFDPSGFGEVQKWLAVVGTAVFWVVMALALAGVTSVLFAFVLGDRGGYREHLAVVCHALLVVAAGSLLLTPLRLVADDLQLTLHLGLFVPVEEGRLARFLGGLDLFWLWTFVVLAVGVHELDRRRSFGVAAALLLLIPVGLAALFAWIGAA